MKYGCLDTRVSSIGTTSVEVLQTKRKLTLVGFDYNLSKKSIPIKASIMSIDLQNDTIIDNMNNNSLLCGGANYLISTAQDREFLCMYMILPLILVNVFIHYG